VSCRTLHLPWPYCTFSLIFSSTLVFLSFMFNTVFINTMCSLQTLVLYFEIMTNKLKLQSILPPYFYTSTFLLEVYFVHFNLMNLKSTNLCHYQGFCSLGLFCIYIAYPLRKIFSSLQICHCDINWAVFLAICRWPSSTWKGVPLDFFSPGDSLPPVLVLLLIIFHTSFM